MISVTDYSKVNTTASISLLLSVLRILCKFVSLSSPLLSCIIFLKIEVFLRAASFDRNVFTFIYTKLPSFYKTTPCQKKFCFCPQSQTSHFILRLNNIYTIALYKVLRISTIFKEWLSLTHWTVKGCNVHQLAERANKIIRPTSRHLAFTSGHKPGTQATVCVYMYTHYTLRKICLS